MCGRCTPTSPSNVPERTCGRRVREPQRWWTRPVAATGGLAEIVDHDVTGMTFPTRDPHGLAETVAVLLVDRARARRLARSAQHMVRTRYGWAGIADRTAAAYVAAMAGGRPQPQRRVARPAPAVPPGRNLLVDAATGAP